MRISLLLTIVIITSFSQLHSIWLRFYYLVLCIFKVSNSSRHFNLAGNCEHCMPQTLPCKWYCVKDGQIYTLRMLLLYHTVELNSFIFHMGDQADHKEGSRTELNTILADLKIS